MQLPGLLGTLSLVSGLILAIPMAVIGVELVVRDRPFLGIAFLGLAVAMLVLPEFVLRRVIRSLSGLRQRLPGTGNKES